MAYQQPYEPPTRQHSAHQQQQPYTPYPSTGSYSLPPQPPASNRRAPNSGLPVLVWLAIIGAASFASLFLGWVIGKSSPDELPAAAPTRSPTVVESPTGSPATEPAEEATEPDESAEPATLEVPDDLVGMNAAVAEDRLRQLGFTNIDFGSVDPDDTVVLIPANWRVIAVEPEPGSEISPDALIVLSCTKED